MDNHRQYEEQLDCVRSCLDPGELAACAVWVRNCVELHERCKSAQEKQERHCDKMDSYKRGWIPPAKAAADRATEERLDEEEFEARTALYGAQQRYYGFVRDLKLKHLGRYERAANA